ncbi:MAG: GAF and ANTAR domain-containing protein [Marmoricola sp.]
MTSRDAALLASLARELAQQADEGRTVRTIVARAADLVPDAEQVTLVVRADHRLTTAGSSSPLAAELDALQHELGEGPSLDVFAGGEVVRCGDTGAEQRWPRWGPVAHERGGRSVCSVQLPGQDGVLGALTLYAGRAGRFDDSEQVGLLSLYAVHAGPALYGARLVGNLQVALESRHTIGAAQGILMQRYGVDLDRSFSLLRRLSSSHNRKLREVADEIVATQRVPGVPRSAARAEGRPGALDDARDVVPDVVLDDDEDVARTG